mgnify:CR=1 FL=1
MKMEYIVVSTLDKMVKTKKRKTRDPARPKRAMTPFLYFACEQRKLLKESDEKMALPEQSRKIAGLWKNVDDKSTYVDLAKVDQARYREQMSHYTPPKKIKRPRSSYAFFMRDVRARVAAANPDKTPRELMSDIAAAWKTITSDERVSYNDMAEKDKQRYADEKSAE